MEIDVALKYSTIKSSFVSIMKKDFNKDILIDACFRTHQIIIYSYQLLRLYILHKYEENTQLKEINRGTIKMLFKALTKTQIFLIPVIIKIKSLILFLLLALKNLRFLTGPKPKGENLSTLTEFNKFYEENYKNNGLLEKIDGTHLSQILEYSSTDMLTNIENNVN